MNIARTGQNYLLEEILMVFTHAHTHTHTHTHTHANDPTIQDRVHPSCGRLQAQQADQGPVQCFQVQTLPKYAMIRIDVCVYICG